MTGNQDLNREFKRLAAQGISMPKSDLGARKEASNIKTAVENKTLASSMRTASNVQFALPKVRKPMSTLEDKDIPYDYTDPEELKDIRRWSRLFYATHDLIPLLVDIYSKFPTSGISLDCKDPKITEFYEDMFFNQLEYETFIQEIGREFFIVGECTTLGHFDELLGVWSREEILNPDQLIVTRPMFQKEERILLDVKPLVDGLRDPEVDLSPSVKAEKEYELRMLQKFYPEIIEAANREEGLELSNVLTSRMVNRTSYWDLRGTPHMLRSFRTLMMEESLNAAQDAVADRLYSPFVLAKLGIQNIGDGQPWIPTSEDLNSVRDDLQTALSADFRLMVHHFGLDISSVFGRESVPRFDSDYNRIDEKLLQAWGIGKSLISGGSGGPYASSALNREFVTQMMSSFQKFVERHMRKRMEVIAEAQGHYDYDIKGGIRKPIMQERVVEDEETGESYVIEVPKLLIPEVRFSTLNLRDEAQERQFMQSLKNMGVPVSDSSLAVNIPINFEEELEKSSTETIKKYVAQSQAMVKARELLVESGLPIPPELAEFFAQTEEAKAREENPEATLGEWSEDRVDWTEESTSSMPVPKTNLPSEGEESEDSEVEKLPRNTTRPPESDSQRATMPKTSLAEPPSSLGYSAKVSKGTLVKRALSESSIQSFYDLASDSDCLRALEVDQFQSDYLADAELYEDWLRERRPVEEVPSSYRDSYEQLHQALSDIEDNYGGRFPWN